MPGLPTEAISATEAGEARGRAAEPATRTAGAAREAGAAKRAAKPRDAAGDGARPEAAGLPVRTDETHWTPDELAEVRAGLQAQIAELRADIAVSTSQIAEGDTSEGAGDDQADAGAKTYAREHELALAYNSQDLLAQSERAVQRMDAGTYGICEVCAEPIGKARLQVFPRATLCVTCKQREERR
ncbi:RNA polymerase-binding protein DksA [Actinomadura algeriensis]|uniref:RNA polymerase-binding protein DksA n=1 Tax=Actinomadura algeriensis TaxID=1679523 RepID=A0ABR9JXK5_9ACTN|nr:RNA polymerase-binding protein DksA [Actinomadura algeriensis]